MVFLGGAGAQEVAWVDQPALQVYYFKVRSSAATGLLFPWRPHLTTTQGVIASTAFWLVACYSCKLSVLILYHNLFSTAWGKKVTPLAVGLTAAFGVSSILSLLLVWHPLSKWWDGTSDAADDVQMAIASRYVDVATCLTDFFIYCLPLRTLWTLKMDRKRREGYVLTFGVGFLWVSPTWAPRGPAVSIPSSDFGCRSTCVISLFRTLYNDLVSSNDEVQILLGVEATFGIMSACIPTVGPLYYKARGRSLDGTAPSKKSTAVSDRAGNELVTFGRLQSGRSRHIYDTLRSMNKDLVAESQTELNSKV